MVDKVVHYDKLIVPSGATDDKLQEYKERVERLAEDNNIPSITVWIDHDSEADNTIVCFGSDRYPEYAAMSLAVFGDAPPFGSCIIAVPRPENPSEDQQLLARADKVLASLGYAHERTLDTSSNNYEFHFERASFMHAFWTEMLHAEELAQKDFIEPRRPQDGLCKGMTRPSNMKLH